MKKNRVQKSLKKKRQRYHAGSHIPIADPFSGHVGWNPHDPNSPGHSTGEGNPPVGSPPADGDPPVGSPPVNNPSPDGGNVRETTPAGPDGGTLKTTVGGGPPRQEIEYGDTYVPADQEVAKLNVTGQPEETNGRAPAVELTDAEMRNQGLTPDSDVQSLQSFGDAGLAVSAPSVGAGVAAATQASLTSADTPEAYKAATYDATQAEKLGFTRGAKGVIRDESIADSIDDVITLTERSKAAERDEAQEKAAMDVTAAKVKEDARSQIERVTGETATVDATREATAQTRSMVATDSAPVGEAAEIEMMYSTQNAQRRQEAKRQLEREFRDKGIDDETAKELAEDPQTLIRKLDSLEDDEIKTTLSGLPREALITTQMDNLLEGMEEGNVPAWARPALAAVEANLAKRGMSASSVGRDSLFAAIIQSAIPLAQGNAQAIQAATSQDKSIAGQFLIKNAEFKQQMEIANLSNDQQMRLANLTARNQADRDNLNAAQQTELANLQSRLQTNLKEAEIASAMNQAQLSVDQQSAVQNAMTVAKIDMANMSAEQQVVMANSKFMQTATLTDFNARQQSAVQNATLMAQMDVTTADHNLKLAIRNADSFLKMDLTNLSNDQQARILDQQLKQQRILSNQAADNAAKQFNATSENQKNQFMTNLAAQMNQFNASQANAMAQFNASESNRIAAVNANNATEAAKAQAALEAQVSQFNSQLESQREQWNAANAQAVEQSNIEWRRKANTIDTAAQNAANQLNAQQQHQMSAAEQANIWQTMRDEAAYNRTAYENEQQRKTSLYATALANESSAGKESGTTTGGMLGLVDGIVGTATGDRTTGGT